MRDKTHKTKHLVILLLLYNLHYVKSKQIGQQIKKPNFDPTRSPFFDSHFTEPPGITGTHSHSSSTPRNTGYTLARFKVTVAQEAR